MDIEWEADVSTDDLLRFAGYNIALNRKYKMPFETVIVTRKKVSKRSYIGGSLRFTPRIINLNTRSGKATLKTVREKLDKGEPVNPLEVVYMPLYNNSGMTYEEVYKSIIEIIPKITPDKNEQDMLLILSALLANKFVETDEYKRILGAIKVSLAENKLFMLLKEEGREEGREEEARKVAKNLLELGISVDIIKKATGLTDSEIDKLQKELIAVNTTA